MDRVDLIIESFVWDNWNVQHIARHNVLQAEVEEAAADKYTVFLRAKLGRIMLLGRSQQRLLAVVLAQESDSNDFYVITARDMSKKERFFYRQQKGANNE